ncbi:MAG: hypothetical protein WBI07_07250 [Mobilitalea sp.]
MQNWNLIRPIAAQILRQQQYRNSGPYNGTRCFLTAYQIAVLVNVQNPSLRGTLPIGGAGVGPDSFARQIAWHLSDDLNRNVFDGSLEIQFFSLAGLDEFTFDGKQIPSTDEFSMFRLT